MKKIIWIVVVLIVIVVGFGIISNDGGNNSSEPIKIGAVISLTGVAADFGENALLAMQMAVEEINASGGVDGHLVELYVEDDHTVPKDAVSAWRKLVDVNDVDAIIGGLFDFVAQPLIPLSEDDQITFISPINFTIEGSFQMNDYSFVLYPEFSKVIRELSSVIAEREIEQLGIIRFQSDFGLEIEKVLGQITNSLEMNSLVSETYAQIGGVDFRTPILKMMAQHVDVVFLDMLDFDIVSFLTRSDELGYKPVVMGYTTVRDVLLNHDLDEDLTEGMIMLDWEIASDSFVKKFENRYAKKPRRGNNKAYDAVYVLAEAIASGDKVNEYVENSSFETINGSFKFTENHSIESTPVKVFEIIGEEFVKIGSNI